VAPQLELLANALDQQSPWAGRKLIVTREWYLDAMRARIGELDWSAARADLVDSFRQSLHPVYLLSYHAPRLRMS
jgi:hypothetical protein